MRLQVGCLMLVFSSLVLSGAAQVGGSAPTRKIVLTDTTIALTGPNGAPAPTVLQVTGGVGANFVSGTGGGIVLTGGDGGGVSGGGPITLAGGNGLEFSQSPGGAINLTGGFGGDDIYGNPVGPGGSITITAGAGRPPGNVILTGGNVGIGTATPANTLEVVASGTTLADAWTTRSSRRFKTNIQPLGGALEKVGQLQGVSYERKIDGKHEIGVVAEDVDEIVPEIVSRDPKTKEIQGVDHSRLAALLIEAVKSQQTEIQQLRVRIEQLTSNMPAN